MDVLNVAVLAGVLLGALLLAVDERRESLRARRTPAQGRSTRDPSR